MRSFDLRRTRSNALDRYRTSREIRFVLIPGGFCILFGHEILRDSIPSTKANMNPTLLVIAYGLTIAASSVAGGYLPLLIQMNHLRMQILLSFIGGMMLGIAVLHLLPHGMEEIYQALKSPAEDRLADAAGYAMPAMLMGLLVTFFLMRAFHFHQHGDEHDSHDTHEHHHQEEISKTPRSGLGWVGVLLGLGLHSFMDGVALGAVIQHGSHHASLVPAGFGVYLAILLHKPLDALSLSSLMSAEKHAWRTIIAANASLGLMCLFGALGVLYFPPLAGTGLPLGCLLAAAAGVFLCISLSDLLPEVQFHQHDRIPLSTALLLGIGVAYLIELSH